MATPLLEIRDLQKVYRMGPHEVKALAGVSLSIDEGDFVAVMGPSGSGKSTLTQILGLLDSPTSGSYKLRGREVSGLSEDELALLRRDEIGFIFQQFHLLPRMSAAENVALPLLYSGKDRPDERAGELLARVGLGDRGSHRPNELSGGQQQRVAIARSLVNGPRLIIADEPTGNLDSASEREIMAILRELNEQGHTLLIVTHEEEIGRQAKRVIHMRDGVVLSDERRQDLGGPSPAALKNADAGQTDGGLGSVELFEHLRQGFKTLAANKVRTGLSMLGILIGVAAVVAMLAIGRGAQLAIEKQLTSLGSNLLVLRAGAMNVGGVRQEAGATTRLTEEDAEALARRVPAIKAVAPVVNGRAQVTFGNRNWNTQVVGTAPAYAPMHSAVPSTGRFFDEDDVRRRARVAVLGTTVVRELFGDGNPLGESIKINKVIFQVVGVLPPRGGGGFRDEDDVLVIPYTTAMRRLLGKNYVDSIEIEAVGPDRVDEAQDDAMALVAKLHRIPGERQEDAFQVWNMADIQKALQSSSQTMALLLSSIAAISLLVGGIGIMNIMLVSVTERTKEIGLRKAIGARRRDILMQFLAESVVVSAVGGLIGIALGAAISDAISLVTGWNTSVSSGSVLLAFFFSAFIGIVFGIYPARKASRLAPIEALRSE